MNHNKHMRNISRPSEALVAVAYQDQLLQDLSIGDLSLSSHVSSYNSVKKKLNSKEKDRKKALLKIKPKVDSGQSKSTSLIKKKKPNYLKHEKEYVLDPLPKKATLGQKLGLFPLPPQPLTESEWDKAKEMSKNRKDFQHPCAICQDEFRLEDQVLLSCSHVFHRSCIQAFERFTGKKSCPMCRKLQYQSRVVYEGTRWYQMQCATKIQSHWRGYVVRKWYQKLRKTTPPKNPVLRKRFYEEKLQEITDRLVDMSSGETVNRFLQDIDESMSSSRKIFQHFEKTQLQRISDEEWECIKEKALEREDFDCSICLRKFDFNTSFNSNLPNDIKANMPKISILSCTHLFHSNCIKSLEEFSTVEKNFENNVFDSIYGESHLRSNNLSPEIAMFPCTFKCPICRSLYVKRIF